jgi:YesN/AraC family two-component response regulator
MTDEEKASMVSRFMQLAAQGFNCKQIAEKMGSRNHNFGKKMKKLLGMYPCVYIARMKNGKT